MKAAAQTRQLRAPRLVFVGSGKREHRQALQVAGYDVTGVASVRKAFALRPRPDGLILELMLPDSELPLLASAIKAGRGARAMTLIGLAGANQKRAVVKAGAAFCLYPCPPEKLLAIVKRAVPLPAPRKRGH